MNYFLKFLLMLNFLFSSQLLSQEAENLTQEKVVTSTELDFDETLVQGQMKAPNGFLLRGRKGSGFSQMVKLRRHFRREIIHTEKGMRARIK